MEGVSYRACIITSQAPKARRKPSSLDNDLSESTSMIPWTASDDSPVDISSFSISSLVNFPNCK